MVLGNQRCSECGAPTGCVAGQCVRCRERMEKELDAQRKSRILALAEVLEMVESTGNLTIRCLEHPKYAAKMKPRANCRACRLLYEIKNV